VDYDFFIRLEKKYPRIISNDFFLPSEIRRMFDAGVVDVAADEKSLLLFEEREGFSKLHFRIIETTAKIKRPNGAIAAFLTYRNDEYPGVAAGWLVEQGFAKTKTLRRYSAREITGEITAEGVDKASVDEAYKMLREYFSAIEADLPCRELFEGALCVRSQDGKLVGMLYMGRTLSVAVSEEVRGQGVGRRLYRAYAATKASEGKKMIFHEWIAPDNAPSIAMFQSLGFKADDVYSDCFVKQ